MSTEEILEEVIKGVIIGLTILALLSIIFN